MEVIEELDNIISAIKMKILKNKYHQEEHLRKAQQHYKHEDERNEMMAEMRKKHQKHTQYVKWVYILEQVEKVRSEIENNMGLEEVVNSFRTANSILELALKKINPDEVHAILDDLETNSQELQEINNILSDQTRLNIVDFDEETAMRDIENQNKEDSEITFIELPNTITKDSYKNPPKHPVLV